MPSLRLRLSASSRNTSARPCCRRSRPALRVCPQRWAAALTSYRLACVLPSHKMDDADPAQAFFPGQEEPDLYGALGVSEEATLDEIKKGYRKLALQYHPDKVVKTSDASAEDAEARTQRFHQISFAYTVLSDEKRRKRFDETGRTDESFFEGEADWNAYFKELWQGEVNGQTLDDFVAKYKGSDEEKDDILAAYTEHKGSLGALFENVMASNVLEDEERFIGIVDNAIKTKAVEAFPQWKKDVKDTKGRNKRKAEATKEATEAEELAKELGVHDKLFGKGNTAENGEANGKTKGKGKAKAKAGGGNVNDEGVDEDALKALIQARNSKQNSMNSLIDRLEAKYGAADGDPLSGGSGSKRKGGNKKKGDNKEAQAASAEPTDEEFEALQKKLFGGDKKGKKSSQDDADEAAAPAKKKLRKSK